MDFCLALPSSYISLLLKSVSNILPAGNTNFPSMFQSYLKDCIEYLQVAVDLCYCFLKLQTMTRMLAFCTCRLVKHL